MVPPPVPSLTKKFIFPFGKVFSVVRIISSCLKMLRSHLRRRRMNALFLESGWHQSVERPPYMSYNNWMIGFLIMAVQFNCWIRDASVFLFNFNFKLRFFFPAAFFFWESNEANAKVKGKTIAFGLAGKRDSMHDTRINDTPLKARMRDLKVIEPNWFTETLSCRAPKRIRMCVVTRVKRRVEKQKVNQPVQALPGCVNTIFRGFFKVQFISISCQC